MFTRDQRGNNADGTTLHVIKWLSNERRQLHLYAHKTAEKKRKKEIKVAVKDFNYAYIARQNKLHMTHQDKEIKKKKQKPLFIHLSNLQLQIFTSNGTI